MAPSRGKKSYLQSQGLLAPEILITIVEHRARDPDTLPEAVIRFCNWCIEEAWLVREEVQPQAWMIYHSSYYIAQVNNGGHGQFAGNSGMKPEVLDDVEAGLAKLDLSALLAVFRRFRLALDSDAALKRRVMEGGGFGEIPEMIRELDDAFFHSRDPRRFHPRATRWLKDAPTVLALTPREIRVRQEAIVASNALLVRRRAAASPRSLREILADAAARLLDKTGLRRPGETAYEHIERQFAARPGWAKEVSDAQALLIEQFLPTVQAEDNEGVDEIFAAFRDLHARYRLETTPRWANDIRTYAYKLMYAGERLGRPELLEQAADAFGQAIVAGPPDHDYDPGSAWRYLGQTLVGLARLDERRVPGVGEALDAFDRALAVDSAKPDQFGYRVSDILGRAEAHLILAAKDIGAGHLGAARDALAEARPLLRPGDRDRWRAVNAELLSLLPPTKVRARERAGALKGLDMAIAGEEESDGAGWANPMRLKRLRQLRAAITAGIQPS